MAELWRPSEHEPLTAEEWDDGRAEEERAEEAIRTIVADAEAAFDGTRWPWHPRDGEEWGFSDVYIGGAGIAWALTELGSTGWGDAGVSFIDHYRARPSPWDEEPVETSYHFGEAGIALVAFRLTGDAGIADRIHELVLAGLDAEPNEVMYGTPGSMLVAEAMLAWTGELRWDEAWRAAAARVEAARDPDGLWTSHLGGQAARYLGPAHGYAGIVRAFANRGPVQLVDLEPYVLRDGALANWLTAEGAGPEQIRVQWCHGAPGIVATLGDLLDPELAVAGGELTWRAGPLAKGPGLCHGTAGNAYAFLVLHRRTGDELWLDRGRAFAMHAIGQVERERAAVGRGRYSLFTGDLGVALFLRHLLDGEDRFPTMGPFAAPG
ncbi:MAG: lanthionine synthetase C family protein [Gaiellaceae bacterium]